MSSMTAGEASQRLGARLIGDSDFIIKSVSAPENATPHSACFAEAESYLDLFRASPAGCWVMTPKLYEGLDETSRRQKVFLLTEKPYLSYVKLIDHFFPATKARQGVHPLAFVDPSAEVHSSAQVDAFVTVGPRTKIGAGVILHSHVWIGDDAVVGDGSILFSGAKVYHHCVVGKRNILHAGSVVGSDGFGFIPDSKETVKIPQVGRAVLHDDVEVGANTTIDRGTLSDTIIGQGTKIDNLVHIGHNCVLGKSCILCAFVGLSGNTTLGDNVIMGGKSASKGHLRIGNNVQVGGQTGVSKNIPDGLQVKGYPALPLKKFLRLQVLFTKLPEIYERLMTLEKEIKEGDHAR